MMYATSQSFLFCMLVYVSFPYAPRLPRIWTNRNWCAENFHLAQNETLICLLHLECRWSALSRWVHCSKYEVSQYINDLFYPGTCHCLGPFLQYTIEANLWNCKDIRSVLVCTAFSLESTCSSRKGTSILL